MRTILILTIPATLFTFATSSPLPAPRAASEPFRCPVRDIIQTKCLGPRDCLYRNPDNCATYFRCEVDPDERSGTPYLMHCPVGLKWNDRKKECDFLIGDGQICVSI